MLIIYYHIYGKRAKPSQSYNDNIFTDIEKEQSQKRCEEVFAYMFGNEKLQEFQKSIEMIYDMQINKQEVLRQKSNDPTGNMTKEKYEILFQKEEIPLEEFKILFNEKIINSNSPKLIEKYLQEKSEGQDAQKLFREIITNTYGKKAEAILESRPNLNVHSINSLEVFDEKILGEFGDAFVHDCISYNLQNFSAFLNVMKTLEKADNFKTYYETLSEIYGKNVDTMQKAMSEFHGVETLLANTKDVELTDRQYSNLISVLCARNNPFQVETLQELQQYDETINKQMDEVIKSPDASADEIKAQACASFLGIDYREHSDYGSSLEFITSLYDVQEETARSENYTKDEQQMLQVLDFLSKEEDISKLKILSKELMQINSKGLSLPITLQTAVQKTIENQTGILNESLTSLDKLKVEADKNNNSKEGNVYYESVDGIDFYHLNGIDFNVLVHDPGKFSKDLALSYEGQAANGAICCRIANEELGNISNKFIYTQVDEGMIVAANNTDADTQHRAKRVVNRGRIGTKIENIPNMTHHGNEVAQNRRYRNHEKVNNKTHGGRVIPNAYCKSQYSELTEEEKEFCKKYSIPVMIYHADKYEINKHKETQIQENESER